MGYIPKDGSVTVRARLTDYARERISTGDLDFTFFALGDSEYYYPLSGDTAIQSPPDFSPVPRFYIKDSECDTDPLVPLPAPREAGFDVVDSATERGFFSGGAINTAIDYVKQFGTCTFSGGTNNATLDKDFNFEEGDFILILHSNPTLGENGSAIDAIRTYGIYRIESKSGVNITLDRVVGNSAAESYYTILPPTFDYYDVSPAPYWDEASNDFTLTCPPKSDVLVWNLNIVYGSDLIGIKDGLRARDSFGSTVYLGQLSYFGYLPSDRIGIVHYTNGTISNFYGESFFSDTPSLDLPTVTWPTKPTVGIKIVSSSELLGISADNRFFVEYRDLLIEGYEDFGSVGKVFPKLKIFVIEDNELLAAMEPKSGRSTVFPTPKVQLITDPDNDPILLSGDTDKELHVSYVLDSSEYYTAIPYQRSVSVSLGTESDSCSIPEGASVRVAFDPLEMINFRESTIDGQGFEYDEFSILLQITDKGELPQSDSWVKVDQVLQTGFFDTTSVAQPFTVNGTQYTGGTVYEFSPNLSYPQASELDSLSFGELTYFIGNVSTDISARVHESVFYLYMDFDGFGYSENPSWDTQYGGVYVTDIGIYDSSRRLVVAGKMPEPLFKPFGENRTIILKIDF